MKQIAVIAVHGVGDQQPLESARAIADLLQDLDRGESEAPRPPSPCTPPVEAAPRYEPFTGRPLRINVRPVLVTDDGPEAPHPGDVHGPFHRWVDGCMERHRADASSPSAADVSLAFMRGQLRCYGGDTPEETYETERFEGTRLGEQGPDRTVHVYELYWADLSRLKAGVLSIFTELYQVLFHLSLLGTHVVDAEAAVHPTTEWRRFRRVQTWASAVLTASIPVLNLFMLAVTVAVAALALLFRVPTRWQTVATWSLVGATIAASWGWWLWSRPRLPVGAWLMPVLSWALFVTLVCFELIPFPPALTHGAAAALIAGMLAVGLALVLRAYDERRPGVKRHATLLASAAFVLALGGMLVSPDRVPHYSRVLFAGVRTFEALNALLTLAWSVFCALALAAFPLGAMARRSAARKPPPDPEIARRSMWTARLMLALPAQVFLILTLVGWGVVASAMASLIGGMRYQPVLWIDRTPSTVATLIDGFLTYGVALPLPLLTIGAALAALPGIWGIVPSAFAEVKPPSLYTATAGRYSQRLGAWLTRTFGGLALSGWIVYLAMTLGFPALFVAVLTSSLDRSLAGWRGLQALGAASGFVFAWLFAMRGSFRKAALGFRPVVEILLDVDNWLRELPVSRNPRARICGRYVSLLRYICAWHDPLDRRPYDAVVIVAHSQGTVISADLLRFLHHERDPQLARLGVDLPVYLFTMGCPLRQLYGRRFPRLYGWATHERSGSMRAAAPDDLITPAPPPPASPDPEELGVARWVNTYRSGDYIGRELWRTGRCEYVWNAGAFEGINYSSGGRRGEFCLGAGAHTHYWDETARPVAWTLDALIARA